MKAFKPKRVLSADGIVMPRHYTYQEAHVWRYVDRIATEQDCSTSQAIAIMIDYYREAQMDK